MDDLRLTQAPVVKTGMLIRRPAREVFEAFVDPALTTQFWFTRGSGRLVAGTRVEWEWEMYGFTAPVDVKAVEPERRIAIEWAGVGAANEVEWSFLPVDEQSTYVRITVRGFAGDGDSLVAQATDSMQGFSLVLAGAKAFLEHGIRLELVRDCFPAEGGEE